MSATEPKIQNAEFYLNSGESVVLDLGFISQVAGFLEHNSLEEDSCDAITAREYATELYRVLFNQRLSNPTSQPYICEQCQDTGMRDSGGFQPWGDTIDVPCECRAEAVRV